MNDLVLVRHAIAYEQDPGQWPNDGLRPLTPDGERSFRKTARGLKQLGHTPDAVLSSPFVRAWRTAEILAEEAGWPAPQPLRQLAATLPPKVVLEAAEAAAPDASSIALVGHEPYLSELASWLLDGGRIEMKKGAVARFRLEAPEAPELRWLLPPKILRQARP